mgnify:CR=1 FL=1
MKRLLQATLCSAGLFVLPLFSELHAQTPAAQTAKQESGKVWMTDFAAAQKLAGKTKKPMLVDFTGSDWCPWCVRLDKEVFAQKAFQDFAAANLILVKIDFPRNVKQSNTEKQQNRALATKYKVSGFPTVLLMDGSGKVIGKTGYRPGGAEAYVTHLKSLLK